MDAAENTGIIETIPLQLPLNTLEINGDASNGQIGVEVLSADGNVQQGFAIDECQVLTTDDIHHQVNWKSVSITQATQPLRLRFILNNASLYSFRLRD